MDDRYYWRNVDRKVCAACGAVHELVTRDCVPVLFEEQVIRYERRLAPREFISVAQLQGAAGDEQSQAAF
jgi:hypothetical protein